MKKQFKYPKHFEEQKKIPKITQKRIKLAEVSLGDFEGRLENELLNWFSLTPQHWIMLHMVMPVSYTHLTLPTKRIV
mgnify:CR=1 FL=1